MYFTSSESFLIDKPGYEIFSSKLILVSLLIIIALISIPIVVAPGNTSIKHALEWDYFMGVISFYLLTFFMWKNKN